MSKINMDDYVSIDLYREQLGQIIKALDEQSAIIDKSYDEYRVEINRLKEENNQLRTSLKKKNTGN